MLEALVLGIVQGLTEFIPVSSTAHLVLFPWFFGWKGEVDSLSFDVALHAGTLLALLLCFWQDWVDMLARNRRQFLLILLASIPAGVLGKLFNDAIETRLRSPLIICASLIIVGIIMIVAESGMKRRTLRELNATDAVIIGMAQAVALIPGVSRSGITITAGLFRKLTRENAARFSFLMSTPVIGGAVLLHVRKLMLSPEGHDPQLFLAGFAASAVTGYAALRFLLGFFRQHGLQAFAYYRFALAAVIIMSLWLRR